MAIYLQVVLQKNIWNMKKKNQHRKQKKNIEETQKNVDNRQNENQQESVQTEDKVSKEEELAQNLQEEKDKYVRLYAEFENFRKRTAKEKLELFDTAAESVIKNLLPVLDDFERAILEMKKNKEEDEWVKGVELIYEKFYKTLEKEGLKPVEVNQGDDFDPEIHEAIAQVPVTDEKMKNKIVDIVEKGYRLGHKIIRFPKVVTGR
jgi:molecular chaperone GrpE